MFNLQFIALLSQHKPPPPNFKGARSAAQPAGVGAWLCRSGGSPRVPGLLLPPSWGSSSPHPRSCSPDRAILSFSCSAPAPVLRWPRSRRIPGEHNRQAKAAKRSTAAPGWIGNWEEGERLSCLGEEHGGEGGRGAALLFHQWRLGALVTAGRGQDRSEEFHIHIPQQITPWLCSRGHLTALWCWSAATPTKCKAEEHQDPPAASRAQLSSPAPPKGVQKPRKPHQKHL